MRKLPILFIVLALAFGPAVSSIAAESARSMLDDSSITASVKVKLAKDIRIGTLTSIEVNTTDGIVTLAGKVKNEDEKKAAEQIAHETEGVKAVKNNLQIVS